MKYLYKVLVTFLVLSLNSCVLLRPVEENQGTVSFQVFYDQLNPYGQWVNNANFGFIWIPDAGNDFSPYSSNGYWVMTEYGWTWVSDYSWGWAPFHYGRWDYDNHFGWFWVPDNEWGPSWVIWRSADDYYGWTPMRPGISISSSYGNGYSDIDHWNFIRYKDFGKRDIHQYYMNKKDKEQIIINSVVINNTYTDSKRNLIYITGPHREDVQKTTGRIFNNIPVRDYEKPGEKINNRELQIYRPQVDRNSNTYQKPVPSKLTEIKDIKTQAERNGDNRRNAGTSTQNKVNTDKQKRETVNSSNSGNTRTKKAVNSTNSGNIRIKEGSVSSAEKTKRRK
jgi:hypothetical protein